MPIHWRGRLWSRRDFRRLWLGQSVSLFGSQVTLLAVPSVAILALHADAFAVGLLSTLEWLAFPTLGLVAGVAADRLPRRPIMLAADLGRALALASIPLAAGLGVLSLAQLYAVAALTGALAVFFDVAYQSYLPALVGRADLVEGNSKLELSASGAQVAGPALAGALIQLVGAARAIGADVASFLASALALAAIGRGEPRPASPLAGGDASLLADIGTGLRVVFRHPILGRLAACTATTNLGVGIGWAVLFLFAYRALRLAPGLVGTALALGSVGFIIGALLAAPVVRRLGLGRTLLLTNTLRGVAALAIPLAQVGAPVVVLAAAQFALDVQIPIYNINQLSLRQAIVPPGVQGRMNAAFRTVAGGALPLGSLLGGFLGAHLGPAATLALGGAIDILGSLWLLHRSVLALREQPASL